MSVEAVTPQISELARRGSPSSDARGPMGSPSPSLGFSFLVSGGPAGPDLAETPSVSGGLAVSPVMPWLPRPTPTPHLQLLGLPHSHGTSVLSLSRTGVPDSGSRAAWQYSPSGAPCTRGREAATSLKWRGECLGTGSLGGGRVAPSCTLEAQRRWSLACGSV